MQERRTWFRWMGAIVTPLVIAGCGPIVLEPITDESVSQPATSAIDPATQIKDFTPVEAEAWCTAHINALLLKGTGLPLGSPELGELCGGAPIIHDGYISDFGEYGSCGGIDCGGEPWLCVVVPTIDLCMQNLALYPCEATLSELDTCVASIREAVDHNDIVCGGGCESFRSHPSCVETVVHELDYWEQGGSRCRLAVE